MQTHVRVFFLSQTLKFKLSLGLLKAKAFARGPAPASLPAGLLFRVFWTSSWWLFTDAFWHWMQQGKAGGRSLGFWHEIIGCDPRAASLLRVVWLLELKWTKTVIKISLFVPLLWSLNCLGEFRRKQVKTHLKVKSWLMFLILKTYKWQSGT